ncbi:MAG: hypothetical protein H6R15_3439 [Proteobacteria bacterium]|nr:hypothetical protein [Pseudomonadota bacterium]
MVADGGGQAHMMLCYSCQLREGGTEKLLPSGGVSWFSESRTMFGCHNTNKSTLLNFVNRSIF